MDVNGLVYALAQYLHGNGLAVAVAFLVSLDVMLYTVTILPSFSDNAPADQKLSLTAYAMRHGIMHALFLFFPLIFVELVYQILGPYTKYLVIGLAWVTHFISTYLSDLLLLYVEG